MHRADLVADGQEDVGGGAGDLGEWTAGKGKPLAR